MTIGAGKFITERFAFDGGRSVTVYVPPRPPQAVVFAGDGQLIAPWGEFLNESVGVPPTLVVGVHRADDETVRLHEYSSGFDPARFAAHEQFFVHEVRQWVTERFDLALAADRTAVFGVSAGGELALALGLRHPDRFGAIFCASPGAGYRPTGDLPASLPRAYFVAGSDEPFFRDNAARWAESLRDAGGEVEMTVRAGEHGGPFWRDEFPIMIRWAFG